MTSGNSHRIFAAVNVSGTEVIRIEFRRSSNLYQIQASARNNAGTYAATSWHTIANGPTVIEINWQAATTESNANGLLNLWINSTLRQTLSNQANGTLRIEEARLGPLAGIDSGTRGITYYDAYVSNRQTYIGP
jgi:hypothetical protein